MSDDVPRVDKGKSRALAVDGPTERTPLLSSSPSTSQTHSIADEEDGPLYSSAVQRTSLCSKLLSVFLVSLSFSVLLFILFALLAYSFGSGASRETPDDLVRKALVLRGPDSVDVLNITWSDGIWVQVGGRVGVDAGAALGVNTDEEDSMLKDMWKSIGRWGVRRVDRIDVELSSIAVRSEHGHLADISIPPLDLPLTVDPPPDSSWLMPMSLPVLIKPTKDVAALARFVRDSWRDGIVNVQASVNQTVINGLNGWLHLSQSDISSTVRLSLPHLPPPDRIPVTLLSFLVESNSDHLSLAGNATIENPIPEDLNIHATVPTLPFTVSLLANDSLAPVANVSTEPIPLTHPNVTLSISGTVLPIPPSAQLALSQFLSQYLRAQDIPIVITTPLLTGLTFPSTFPAPHPKPQVLRNVTIRNMMVRYSTDGKGNMVASGTVYGRAVLPKGIRVGLDVRMIFPDVLVFDGEVLKESEGDDGDGGEDFEDLAAFPKPRLPHVPLPHIPQRRMSSLPVPPLISLLPPIPTTLPSTLPSTLPRPRIPMPALPIGHKAPHTHSPPPPPPPSLPSPLPPRAFAHIRPDDWLVANCTPVVGDNPDEGTVVDVEAKISDVPLEVLPGREKEFRRFVSKVIFSSHGALAGVQGTAAVLVRIDGLPFQHGEGGGEMELVGLPFEGKVVIGKRSLFDLQPAPEV